ncbi:MAG TPA: hypothetical protein VGQ99_02800 [Tepidisphaeraceae bacterium]|jgi:hypothetical protein|nr:hypothetical protein [Tepidisphaeraceae bacterium]
MHRRDYSLLAALLCICLVSAWAKPVLAEDKAEADKKPDSKFLRFVDDGDGGGRLEAAIATYEKDGVKVHLVSAVHVGEKKYYDDLSKTFQGYDSLLYEMVKPKDAPVPGAGARSESMVSAFQRMLKEFLELDFQLDAIDYTAKNFVHADLDAETFERMQAERGESIFTLMLRQILDEMSKPQQAPEVALPELVMAFLSPDSARHFKLMLAKQFQDIDSKVSGLEGPGGSVLVTERNNAALKVMKDSIAKGQKNIGIFYGAAHMSGISKKLEEMGFKHVKTEWRVAWDMTPKEGDFIIKQVKKKPEAVPQN